MSSGIARIRASKYFPYAIIGYLGYLLILFILSIPYLPEILELISKREISTDELYINPILPLGLAVILPLILIYILVDYQAVFSQFHYLVINPLKQLDRRILVYTNLFLFLQLAMTLLIVVILSVLVPNFLLISDITSESRLLIWIVGGVSCLILTITNVYIGWKWTKSDLNKPNALHWFIGYLVYLTVIGIGVLSIQGVNPSVKGIILWPFSGIFVIGAFSYFIVVLGLFLVGLDVLVSPGTTAQSDAGVGFVLMAGMLFMMASFFLLFIPLITYATGVFLANWQAKRR
ncbi:MAG: hypothetical protein ACW98F_03120 [Candidatus Hodarchaeales archaeon]|jgi:hypothetical protein